MVKLITTHRRDRGREAEVIGGGEICPLAGRMPVRHVSEAKPTHSPTRIACGPLTSCHSRQARRDKKREKEAHHAPHRIPASPLMAALQFTAGRPVRAHYRVGPGW